MSRPLLDTIDHVNNSTRPAEFSQPNATSTNPPRKKSTWVRIVNPSTGETVLRDTSPTNRSYRTLLTRLTAFDRLSLEPQVRQYFITLTLSDENIDNQASIELAPFIQGLRRRCIEMEYAWIVAIQEDRSKDIGQPVLHWHLLVACQSTLRWEDLPSLWGKGFVHIEDADGSSRLRQYVAKHVDSPDSDIRKIIGNRRRWGTSQLGVLGYQKWAYNWVTELLAQCPELASAAVRRVGATVGFYARQGREWIALRTRRSPWQLQSRIGPNHSTPFGQTAGVAGYA
jgi:hypothetical protein